MINGLLMNRLFRKVNEPTNWSVCAHFVPKHNGNIRLATDYTVLNKYITTPFTPFPMAADIFQRLRPSSKYFCTLDLKSAFFQMSMDDESQKLKTFLHPNHERYAYTRTPMRLRCSNNELNINTAKILQKSQIYKS